MAKSDSIKGKIKCLEHFSDKTLFLAIYTIIYIYFFICNATVLFLTSQNIIITIIL